LSNISNKLFPAGEFVFEEKVLVIGGKESPYASAPNVEVIHFGEDKTCAELADFPFGVVGDSANFVAGSLVVHAKRRCRQLKKDNLDEWSTCQGQIGSSFGHKSIAINDFMLISGGRTEEGQAKNDLIFWRDEGQSKGQIRAGPSMPSAKFGHCLVALNDSHVFISAGNDPSTFLFHRRRGTYLTLPSIPGEGHYGACGKVEREGSVQVVVAGGKESFGFSVGNVKWRAGAVLPDDLRFRSYVQVSAEAFLAAGGLDEDNEYSKSVYKFDGSDFEWKLVGQLKVARAHAVLVAVPQAFLNCS